MLSLRYIENTNIVLDMTAVVIVQTDEHRMSKSAPPAGEISYAFPAQRLRFLDPSNIVVAVIVCYVFLSCIGHRTIIEHIQVCHNWKRFNVPVPLFNAIIVPKVVCVGTGTPYHELR